MTGSTEFDDAREGAPSPWASPSSPTSLAWPGPTVPAEGVPAERVPVQSIVTVPVPAALRGEPAAGDAGAHGANGATPEDAGSGCSMPETARPAAGDAGARANGAIPEDAGSGCSMPETARPAAPARHAAVDDEAWPTREMMAGRPVRAYQSPVARPALKAEPPVRRGSALGLTGLVFFALLAAFFAWVTAEPLWLAVGHGDDGKATAIQCIGSGVRQRCVGDFTSESGLVAERVALLGVDQTDLSAGGPQTQLAARMVGTRSDQAYVGAALRGLHLRWGIGFILAMLCGLGIALSTGAIRFSDRRARRAALATSFTAPLLLLAGFLAATF